MYVHLFAWKDGRTRTRMVKIDWKGLVQDSATFVIVKARCDISKTISMLNVLQPTKDTLYIGTTENIPGEARQRWLTVL